MRDEINSEPVAPKYYLIEDESQMIERMYRTRQDCYDRLFGYTDNRNTESMLRCIVEIEKHILFLKEKVGSTGNE